MSYNKSALYMGADRNPHHLCLGPGLLVGVMAGLCVVTLGCNDSGASSNVKTDGHVYGGSDDRIHRLSLDGTSGASLLFGPSPQINIIDYGAPSIRKENGPLYYYRFSLRSVCVRDRGGRGQERVVFRVPPDWDYFHGPGALVADPDAQKVAIPFDRPSKGDHGIAIIDASGTEPPVLWPLDVPIESNLSWFSKEKIMFYGNRPSTSGTFTKEVCTLDVITGNVAMTPVQDDVVGISGDGSQIITYTADTFSLRQWPSMNVVGTVKNSDLPYALTKCLAIANRDHVVMVRSEGAKGRNMVILYSFGIGQYQILRDDYLFDLTYCPESQ